MASGTINKVLTIDDVYPVGAVYISVNNTSPATLFGGTWTKISGRFLLATGTCAANSDSYFGSIKSTSWNAELGSTGGEDYHTLSVSEMPSHSHEIYSGYGDVGTGTSDAYRYQFWGGNSRDWHGGALGTNSKGGSTRHNNMPPYMAVNMWYRTA